MNDNNKINIISSYEAEKRGFIPIFSYKITPPDVIYDNIEDPVVVDRGILNKLIETLNLTHKDFKL